MTRMLLGCIAGLALAAGSAVADSTPVETGSPKPPPRPQATRPGSGPAAPAMAAPRPAARKMGSSRTVIKGCLLAKSEEAAQRTATKAMPSEPSKPDIKSIAGGARVTHALSHACCLKGKVTTNVSGKKVAVIEKLSGEPCRCVCGSTLTTDVVLAPGEWNVTVDVDLRGEVTRVAEEKVKVAPAVRRREAP